ncbi:MAG: hypothetical protein ACKVZJ_15460 [Phycisphaerales bacterium]
MNTTTPVYDTNSPDAPIPELVEPPKWPKVIGIISIVWGVLSVGCIGCGVIGLMVPMMFGSSMSQAFPDGMPPMMTQGPDIWMIALFVVGAVTAAFLIAAGATMLARKYAARWMHLVWAVVTILSTFGSTAMQVKMQQETKQWIRDNPNTEYAKQQAQFAGMGEMIGMVVGLALGLGYPIFCCVWFGLVKKDPEEYSRGIEQLV